MYKIAEDKKFHDNNTRVSGQHKSDTTVPQISKNGQNIRKSRVTESVRFHQKLRR